MNIKIQVKCKFALKFDKNPCYFSKFVVDTVHQVVIGNTQVDC